MENNMSKVFKREARYVVFKISDLRAHSEINKQNGPGFSGALPGHAKPAVQKMLEELASNIRRDLGKPALECVVVEHDWPEYESTWRSIQDRITNDE
jgi:hypothetical protein